MKGRARKRTGNYIDEHQFGLLDEFLFAASKHVETDRQKTLKTSHVEAGRHLHLLGRPLFALALALQLALDRCRDGSVLVLARHDQRHVVNLVREHEVLFFLLE